MNKEYYIDEDVPNLVDEFIAKRKGHAYYGICLMIGGILSLYIESGKTLSLNFFIVCFLLIALLWYIAYKTIVPQAKQINKIAISVSISDEEIMVVTSPFKVLFYKLDEQIVTFKRGSFRMRDSSYPIKEIYEMDKGSYKLFNTENEVYIITEYYDQALKKQLDLFSL